MIEDEWKKMERVIPVAPWTYLDLGCDKEERKGKRERRMKKKEQTNSYRNWSRRSNQDK